MPVNSFFPIEISLLDEDGDHLDHRIVDKPEDLPFGKPFRIVRTKVRKPREFWVNVYDNGYEKVYLTKEQADFGVGRIECIHVREVIEGE